MNKYIYIAGLLLLGLGIAPQAFAHVQVEPNHVGIAAYQTFTLGVPNEQSSTTTTIRLIVPKEVGSVTPTVKPGWKIDVKKEGEGATVSEISWSGGTIPVGQRDEFRFAAKTPATPMSLSWKVYQTYADGTVVSWDQPEAMGMSDAQIEALEKEHKGPASITNVVNDLAANTSGVDTTKTPSQNNVLIIALIALGLSVLSLMFQFTMKK